MNILIPQGIGDAIWALHKIQSVANGNRISVHIACSNLKNKVEARAFEFIQRFDFLSEVHMFEIKCKENQAGCILLPGPPADENGYYRYISDGPNVFRGIDYVLMPNAALERGIRLEDWLPQFAINWNVMDHYRFTPEEEQTAADFAASVGPFAVFFMGSEASNSYGGHNRDGIWPPCYWIQLGKEIEEKLNLKIVVVGASYDRDYFEKYIAEHCPTWVDCVGKFNVSATYAVVRKSRFIISYQSGIGIVSNYFGVPTGIFWRAKGDSISSEFYLSFEEGMASAWANPKMIESGKHMPLIYGRHTPDYVINEIIVRKW